MARGSRAQLPLAEADHMAKPDVNREDPPSEETFSDTDSVWNPLCKPHHQGTQRLKIPLGLGQPVLGTTEEEIGTTWQCRIHGQILDLIPNQLHL